jgi:hypothetical protein
MRLPPDPENTIPEQNCKRDFDREPSGWYVNVLKPGERRQELLLARMGFEPAKNRKTWWRRFYNFGRMQQMLADCELADIVVFAPKPIREPRKARLKLRKADKKFARRAAGGPIFQVIDGNADPKTAMIAAYRRLEWQRDRADFCESLAELDRRAPLPEPKTPALVKGRQARSIAEETQMSLRKRGLIK